MLVDMSKEYSNDARRPCRNEWRDHPDLRIAPEVDQDRFVEWSLCKEDLALRPRRTLRHNSRHLHHLVEEVVAAEKSLAMVLDIQDCLPISCSKV